MKKVAVTCIIRSQWLLSENAVINGNKHDEIKILQCNYRTPIKQYYNTQKKN